MKQIIVAKSAFKPKVFAYLRRVEQGDRVCITDHGRPVVDLVPHGGDDDQILRDLRGQVTRYEDPEAPTGEAWDVLS